jgi:MoxR-like ATPase
MLQVWVDYPSEEDELQIILRTTGGAAASLAPILDGAQLEQYLQIVRRIPVAESVARLAMQIARLTRPSLSVAPEIVRKCVSWGAGPRGSQYLVLGAKARAALHGKPLVTNDDVLAVAKPVLRHRLKLNFQAEAEGISAEQIIQSVIDEAIGKPAKGTSSETFSQVFRS